jgi:hypothetical protein
MNSESESDENTSALMIELFREDANSTEPLLIVRGGRDQSAFVGTPRGRC